MQPLQTCPHCGVELAEDAPKGLCGPCLLSLGLDDLPAIGHSRETTGGGEQAYPGHDRDRAAGDLPNPPGLDLGNQDANEVIYHFGDYELLKEIARGGMGVVYKARQTSLNRIIAVKMILGGCLARREFVERFRQEAQAAAKLQHSNIVSIHEVGEHAGQHYFTMDYVQGRNLAELVADIKGGAVEWRRAARWMKTIAEAIGFAHEQGTIHRDLKPSNILIDRNDEPQITDFGLARSLNRDSELTASGQVMGTPSFLPPEQASGSRVGVGPSSDVYGLGAVLYFLLTGRAPFAGYTLEATLDQVLHHEPVCPRLLNPGIPRDLETICLKCLEKDPARRYASARELADELERFLEQRPILARPIGTAGRVLRWCRRKPMVAALGLGLVLAMALGSGGVAWQWRQTERQRQVQRRIAYVAGIRAAQLALEQKKPGLAVTLLRQQRPKPGEGEDLRGVEWQYLWRETRGFDAQRFLHPARLKDVALSPDGHYLATLAWDDRTRIWDTSTGRVLREFPSQPFPSPRKSLAFSSDGRRLVFPGPAGIEIVETLGWTRLDIVEDAGAPLSLSADGERLVSVEPDSHRVLQSWDLRSRTKRELTTDLVSYYNLASSPDGRQIAFSTANPFWGWLGQIVLWDAETSRTEVLQEHSDSLSLAISPNGKWLASGHLSGEVCCWRLSDRRLAVRFKAHSGSAYGLAFSPDSRLLATGGTDALICLWEAGTTNRVDSWAAMSPVRMLSFSRNGQKLASGSWAGRTARLWDPHLRRRVDQTFRIPGDVITLGSLPDGNALVTSDAGGRTICFWHLPDGELIRSNVWDADRLLGCSQVRCFAANGLAVGVDAGGTVHLWDLVTQAHLRSVPVGSANFTPAYLSRNGRWLLGHGSDGHGVLCDLQAERTVAILEAQKSLTYPADFSPDGRWLAYCINSSTIKIWDLEANRQSFTLEHSGFYVTILRFSPDSKTLASGYGDGVLKLWSVGTGELLIPPLQGHQSMLRQVAFSSDGRTLVSCDTDLTTHWWNLATGREMLLVQENTMVGGSEYLAFESYYGSLARLTSGGKWIVEQGRQGLIRVTPLPTLSEVDARERELEEEERSFR